MYSNNDSLKRAALGAVAGVAGTFLIHGLLTARSKAAPSTVAPMKQDPGEFMTNRVERALPRQVSARIPDPVHFAAAKALGPAYGATFGAMYGAIRPKGGSALVDGVLLGLLCWAAGYLGWLPATGLMPPIWKQKPRQIAFEPIEHAIYGVTTVAAFDWLAEHV